MAVGAITLKHKVATIECDDTENDITVGEDTLTGIPGTLVNGGGAAVYIRTDGGTVQRDDTQQQDEVLLPVGASMPVLKHWKSITHRCAAATNTLLYWFPSE